MMGARGPIVTVVPSVLLYYSHNCHKKLPCPRDTFVIVTLRYWRYRYIPTSPYSSPTNLHTTLLYTTLPHPSLRPIVSPVSDNLHTLSVSRCNCCCGLQQHPKPPVNPNLRPLLLGLAKGSLLSFCVCVSVHLPIRAGY